MIRLPARLLHRIAHDWLLLALLAGFPVLFWIVPLPLLELKALVDWKTVSALAGLMVLSRALEVSGLMDRLGRWILQKLQSLRIIAVAMVLFAAALAAVVTNDVALFVTVPLTLSLARRVELPVARLVIFQALAVNAGSALSPVGNPQNLFLWQLSGSGFWEFALAMLPIGGLMLAMVLALVPLAFGSARLAISQRDNPLPLEPRLMGLSLLAYPAFLWAVNAGQAVPGALLIIGGYALAFRRVLGGVDWALLLVFALMFVNLGMLGQIPVIAAQAELWMQGASAAFGLGAVLSQVMSNVPAAIFLAPFTEDWRALAWGVNVGGFGLAIGSLANLIALRLAPQPGIWRDFHFWSVPMLVVSALAGALLLSAF